MTTLIPIEHARRGRRGLILRNGPRFGEASPLVGRSRESFDDVLRAIAIGEPAPPSLDFARWSLDTKLGSAPITSQVLLENPVTAIDEARAAIAIGHRAFKLKIRSREDAEIAGELRALRSDLLLRVDANRAFASEALVPWDSLTRARVEWIEEPCPDAGSITQSPVPIALDESVLDDPNRAIEDVAAHRVVALVLKPTLVGARETMRIAREGQAHHARVIVSHAFESDVARRAAEELARRIAPGETHGLHRWDGIDAYRIAAGGAPLRTLVGEHSYADSALR